MTTIVGARPLLWPYRVGIICGAFATEIGEMEILGRLSRG